MGVIGGDRHYKGPTGEQPAEWRCPTCRSAHVTPPQLGCPTCGAGTKEQAEEARARVPQELSAAVVARAVMGESAIPANMDAWARDLSAVAQLTLARALAFYAEHGTPVVSGEGVELPRPVIVGWARMIDAALPPTSTQN